MILVAMITLTGRVAVVIDQLLDTNIHCKFLLRNEVGIPISMRQRELIGFYNVKTTLLLVTT